MMPQPKFLIVDDEPNIRTMEQCCLEDLGEVIQAANGVDALAAVEEHKPDLMILDLAMPLLDGMSVLAELKHLWARLPTRVIVVTAHGSVKTAIQALRLGASDFVEKPFSPEELRQSVQAVLKKAPETEVIEEGYAQTLHAVRTSLQNRKFHEAERKLMKAGTITSEEPWFLNLAGILHESLGRMESARKFYSRAVGKDRHYRPAQINLERLGEIRRNGRSKIPVAFGGDEVDAGSEGPLFNASEFDRTALTHSAATDVTWRSSECDSSHDTQFRGVINRGAVRRLSDWRPRRMVRSQ
jgi:DNA-binding response OmpR family regulator